MQVVSHPGEVDTRPLQSCSYAAQLLWSAALQTEERRKHFERGGSRLYSLSAARQRAVEATIVAWPCRSSAERRGDAQHWALRLMNVPAHKAAALQLQADVKHNCKA